jgi:hypothetical protein
MAIHVESNPVSVDNTTGAKEAGSMEIEKGQVTKLLKAMSQGDPEAADKLLPLVYGELHRLASSYMRNERPYVASNSPDQRGLPSIGARGY